MDLDTRTLAQAGLIGYIALIAAAFITGNPLVQTLADVAFGIAVILLGIVTYQIPIESRVKLIAAGGFVAAGITQFVQLATGIAELGLAGTLFLLAGLVGYIALRRETTATPF
ncbi:hypothetical protein ACFQJC_12490 [Haloferax namakaokahaiae]|uniref:Uncharacterized protein n=1 Tax=Haloferax namakaokahaiae TaxID=1748331 RepID=A0ABD5ZGG9_9EURY